MCVVLGQQLKSLDVFFDAAQLKHKLCLCQQAVYCTYCAVSLSQHIKLQLYCLYLSAMHLMINNQSYALNISVKVNQNLEEQHPLGVWLCPPPSFSALCRLLVIKLFMCPRYVVHHFLSLMSESPDGRHRQESTCNHTFMPRN